MYTASNSTTSLVSTQSDTPLCRSRPQKDFSAAFAVLQSTYGASGHSPCPIPRTVKAVSVKAPDTLTPSSTSPKDFESALANLSSSYGFSGALPSLPRKVDNSNPSPRASKQTPSVASPVSTEFEAAHGKLSSSYGFGGHAPCLPTNT